MKTTLKTIVWIVHHPTAIFYHSSMKRLTVAILACFLDSCASDKPKPVTAKQAAQVNVMAKPPTPLEKIAASEEHLSEFPVWLWNHTVGSFKATALSLAPTGAIIGEIQVNTQVSLTGGTTTAGSVTVTTK
jgi:hypothetical protein